MSAEVNSLVLLPMSNNVSGPIGFLSLSPLSPAIDRKDRLARAAIHLQRGAGKPLDRRAILDVGVEDLLQLRGERRVIGARRPRREGNGAEKRKSDEQSNPHLRSAPPRIGPTLVGRQVSGQRGRWFRPKPTQWLLPLWLNSTARQQHISCCNDSTDGNEQAG